MKIPDKSKVNKSRFKIQRAHIIDTKKEIGGGEPIYIRDILDSASSEYKSSSLSAKNRLDIIGNLGLETLTPLLEKCFKSKGYPASEAQTAVIFSVVNSLNGAYPELKFGSVENSAKTGLVIQLISESSK